MIDRLNIYHSRGMLQPHLTFISCIYLEQSGNLHDSSIEMLSMETECQFCRATTNLLRSGIDHAWSFNFYILLIVGMLHYTIITICLPHSQGRQDGIKVKLVSDGDIHKGS